MANTFKSYYNKSVGTSAATIYSCPSSTQTTVIGLSVANTTTSPITCDAYITRSAVDYYLIDNGTVPVGASLVIVGGDQKVVLQANDSISIAATANVDSWISVLEIS